MRLPLQGGLPPVDAVAGAVVEIACDESGFSGTNLLDPSTPVITHASVDVSADEAARLIAALRSGFRYSPSEFKSGQFLRGPGAGEALEWFLAALSGRAHVHLVDKEFFLVTRIVDLLLAEPSYAAGTRLTHDQRAAALTLYRAGARLVPTGLPSLRPSSNWSGSSGGIGRIAGPWSGSSRRGMLWYGTGSEPRPTESSTGSVGPACGLF